MLAHGHTVLRLPPYHPDLNPIELIWATVKNNVSKKNITFKLEDVRKLAEHEFDQITPEEWQKRCQHVINIEQKYLENEAFTDIHTEINPLIINLKDDSSTAQAVVKVKKIIIWIVLNKFYFKFNFLYHLFPLFKLSMYVTGLPVALGE
jgi:hypothetical protein